MGSSGSKPSTSCSASKTSSSSGSFRKARSKGQRSFHSYCLGNTSGSRDSDNEDEIFDHQNKGTGNDAQTNPTEEDSNERKILYRGNVQSSKSDDMHFMSSSAGHDEWSQASISNHASRTDRSSAFDSSTHSLNPSNRFLSRFSLIPGNVSFRLSRTTSLGSSRSCPVSSPIHTMLNNEDELHLHAAAGGSFDNTGNEQHGHVFPVCLVDSTQQCFPDTPDNSNLNTVSSGLSNYSINDPENSRSHELARNRRVNRQGNDVNCYSPRVHTETESVDVRQSDRRIGTQEPGERNVRFSRTLSVGRLRDRVLRRSSLSDFTFCPPQQERVTRNASQNSGRSTREGVASVSPSNGHAVNSPSTAEYTPSGVSSPLFGIQDYDVDISRPREARYQDLLEHRSNFLERRRGIRSQVRALQRLGSRFENLSGHDRSCILSGQHRTGRCTCRLNGREANGNDDNSARASISRIVMLAEALFEVLDEIHQQSVVLSSRPSVSSIGSVPAPNEVVESLPIKLYAKLRKHQEEVAQCYICLVEYEDGDSMRVLPCHHEFHRSCVDKWLKEIHRVCPLCRGDICSSGSLPVDN